MAAQAPPKPPSSNRRGVVQRFTGKVGPLPVWAWALLILVAGYLVYRLTGVGSSSTTTPASTDTSTTPTTSGDTGSPPSSGQGGSADNLNDTVLASLGGLQGSVDSLIGLVQQTPAFEPGDGSSGSGSTISNDGVPATPPPAAKAPAAKVTKPSAAPPASAKVRYYTFAPGKAPKGRAKDAAPAKGPAGTTLHFKKGRGYFYA